MKQYFIVFVFFTFGIIKAQITTDHLLHFGAGAAVSGATYTFVYTSTKNKKKAFWYSFGSSVLAGVLKETYDEKIHKREGYTYHWDTSELLSTALGALTASTTINIFVGKRNRKQKIAFVN
jgi:uncharacterized protein YfiM (DUF2279 family)